MPTAELLAANQLSRFYRGGRQIAAFRGHADRRDDLPEDWIGSTTCVHGSDKLGLSTLPDGRLLRDAIASDPVGYLGPAQVAARGPDPGLLVKLLDAGERLPVHCHPGREFARRHLGSYYGKTEAWIVIGAGPDGGTVHLGFAEPVSREQLRQWVDAQDSAAMLAALNELRVQPGDIWLVPAGVPHAIGAGLLIVELQEPTDLSVLLEWCDFPIDGTKDGHLGLGFGTVLHAVDRTSWPADRLATLRGRRDGSRRRLPPGADPFFELDWIEPGVAARGAAGFAIAVALAGTGSLEFAASELPLSAGDTALLPYAAGAWVARGDLELLVCRPPRPGGQS
jgi:mannose-6-phosphate isomerase